ncbi:MAG: hypothetical protein V3V67_05600 [Myxococcota bacterium]
MKSLLDSLMASDLGLTGLVSALALLVVWVPFYRGMRLLLEARSATRTLSANELKRVVQGQSVGGVEPIAALLLRVHRKSLQQKSSRELPHEFVVDASRQYAVNEYDAHYACRISMYSNILPPIGFIGTTGGLLILFFSMHMSNASLELGALALALVSTILALMGFAVLEGLKIGLYGRMLRCIDHALEEALRLRASAAASSASASASH